jgi:uncharacterized protein (DUF2336 family)
VLFDDILQKVFDEVPFARQELAERLAARADAPWRVVVKLAGDTIAVAAPVLTHSPVLQDDNLAPLAGEKSQDHLLAIAKRSWVSERITDILLDRGGLPGARFDCRKRRGAILSAGRRRPGRQGAKT